MREKSELRVVCSADAHRVRPLRHALSAFLNAIEVDGERIDDVLTAVGEALANAIEHAYQNMAKGFVELSARHAESGTLEIDVVDHGSFIERERREDRGLGFKIIQAVVRSVSVDTSEGTCIKMIFDA